MEYSKGGKRWSGVEAIISAAVWRYGGEALISSVIVRESVGVCSVIVMEL